MRGALRQFAVLAAVVLLPSLAYAQGTLTGTVRDGSGGSLHDRLAGSAELAMRASERMHEMEAMHSVIDERTQRSLQHIGLVRFNPFDDTGSDQSFAIALLDDRSDGIVISSLHGRANTRVFAKPVANGGSPHNLSDEESEAIRIATEGTRPA